MSFELYKAPIFKETGYRSRYDNGWRYVNEILRSDLNASDDKTLLPRTLTAGKDWRGLLVADGRNHLAAWCETRLGPSTIPISKADSSVEISQRKSPVTDGKTSETGIWARPRPLAQALRLHHNRDGLTADSQEDFHHFYRV